MKNLFQLLLFICPLITWAQGSNSMDSLFRNSIQQCTYPITVSDGRTPWDGTCFFIKHMEQPYIVTARHLFADLETGKTREFKLISIYTNPENWNELGWEITSENLSIVPVCLDTNCYDITIIPIKVPKERYINFVNTDFFLYPSFRMPLTQIYIPGYPNQHFRIVETTIADKNPGGAFMYTHLPSSFGASGAPVFGRDNENNPILVGIYSGRDTSNNTGLVSKIGILRNFLFNK